MDARARPRLLQAAGLLVLAVALMAGSETGRASLCPERSLLDGGPQIPGFCIDFGNPRAAPMLLAGLALLVVVLGTLWWAAGRADGWATPLRCLLLVALAGALLVFSAWTGGTRGSCTFRSEAAEPVCSEWLAPWAPWAYALGGALLGASATAAAGLLWLVRRVRA